MTELIKAIKSGNLEEVKREYLRDNSSLNTEHEFYQTRPIDFAAQNGHLAILDYLIKQGASLSPNPTRPSILYWFMNAVNSKSKPEILEWVQSNQAALFATDPTLTSDHLKAFLGEEADLNSRQEHGGLFPFHYGILSDNPYAKKWLIDFAEQPFPQNGQFKSHSLPLLLAENNRWDLLKELAHNTLIDLNWELPFEHPNFGVTIAWLLAFESQWDLLKDLATKNSDIALNAGPKHKQHPKYRVTLASILVYKPNRMALFEELAAKSVWIDLDAHAPKPGYTLAYLLAIRKKWDLLKKYKSSIIDLEAGPNDERDECYGMTLAYLLAHFSQWALLKELVAKRVAINLKVSPKNEKNVGYGVTLAYLLVLDKEWDLLKELAAKSETIDLDAGPKNEKNVGYGTTLAYLLVLDKEWDLLKELAAKSETIDLDAGPKNEKNVGYGTTLAYLLVLDKEWDLLKELAAKSETIDLDAGPKNAQHIDYGITLAYLLAYEKRWDLLKELAAKGVTINLDAGCKNEKNVNHGATLAYLLANYQKWDLLKELAAKRETINFEAGLKNEQHIDYGITFAYSLASCRQWDLLKELAAKSETINLESGPKNEQHIDYGITFAYSLASCRQWDLLKELAAKSETINLEASPKNEKNVNHGATLAYLLASCRQWDLLQELPATGVTINLDAGLKSSQHHWFAAGQGITLAYDLVKYKKWDILKEWSKNCSKLDLNAGPKNEQYIEYGITVAWFLANYNQWDLLENLMTKSPPITVNAGCKTKEGFKKFGEKDFLSLLVGAEQWRLLERIVESNLQVSDIDENAYLNNLKRHCSNPTINQLVFYYQVKEKEREINQLIINFHSVYEAGERLPEKNRSSSDALSDFETSLDAYRCLLANFSPEGIYYKKAMDSKMHLLMQFDVSNIHEAFLDTVLKVFPSPQTFSGIEGKREQVRYLTIDSAFQAGNHAYTMQAYASQLKENRTLRKEKRALEGKLEGLEQKTSKEEAPFNATISNSLPTQIPSPRLELKGSKRDFNSAFFLTADLSDGESVKMLKQENLDEVENRADLDSESQRLPSPCL